MTKGHLPKATARSPTTATERSGRDASEVRNKRHGIVSHEFSFLKVKVARMNGPIPRFTESSGLLKILRME
jgi:hypothetical protein